MVGCFWISGDNCEIETQISGNKLDHRDKIASVILETKHITQDGGYKTCLDTGAKSKFARDVTGISDFYFTLL